MTAGRLVTLLLAVAVAGLACGGGSPDPRYPSRQSGCAVKRFPDEPTMPVDELGTVSAECNLSAPACERELLDAVCARGGDVAWGFGANALTAARPVVHAAHSRRAGEGTRERGCAVQVFTDVAPPHSDNIGPVTAWCSQDDSRDVCLRELQDQVCLLGGDALWQVEGPSPEGNKQRMRGRAAHTK